VARARSGSADAALLVGTPKDLVEATAKHVINECGSALKPSQRFPTLLEQAFGVLGLSPANWQTFKERRAHLDASTEWERVVQAIDVLGRAINDLRNAQGTGHGRAELPTLTEPQSKIPAEAAALVASLLLLSLEQRSASGID